MVESLDSECSGNIVLLPGCLILMQGGEGACACVVCVCVCVCGGGGGGGGWGGGGGGGGGVRLSEVPNC